MSIEGNTSYESGKKELTLSDLEKKYQKDTHFLRSELQKGNLTEEGYEDAMQELYELIYKPGTIYSQEKLQEINKDYSETYKDILGETGLALSEMKEVAEFQKEAYIFLNIDALVSKNSMFENFLKGLIDAIAIDNYELVQLINKNGIQKFLGDLYDTLTSWDGLVGIAEALGESVWGLFSGNAYRKGRSIGELGLITTGAGAVGSGLKMIGKQAIKSGAKTSGKVLTKTGDVLLTPINISKKGAEVLSKGAKTAFEVARRRIPDDFKPIQVSRQKELGDKVKNGVELSKEEIKDIIATINTNFPALSILSTLSKGDTFQNTIFTGVKKLNDSVSPIFADEVLNTFKKATIKKDPKMVVLWNDYKNFLSGNLSDIPLGINELNKILQESYIDAWNKLPPAEQKKALEKINGNPLGVHSENGKIKGNSQEDILYDIGISRMNLEKLAQGTKLDGEGTINLHQKLQEKYGSGTEQIGTYYHGSGKVEGFSSQNGILSKEYQAKDRMRRDTTHIFDAEGDFSIDIITKVRKGEIPDTSPLYQDIRAWIDGVIGNGEFIAPFIKDNGLSYGKIVDDSLYGRYMHTIDSIETGKPIHQDNFDFFFRGSYKGELSKQEFFTKMETPGEVFIIDIADMGSMNIKEMFQALKEFHTIKKDLDLELETGKIDKETYENLVRSAHKKVVLESGSRMTEKFQNLRKALRKKLEKQYPGKEIHMQIGGDEINIKIDGVTPNPKRTRAMMQEIFKSIDRENIKGRVAQKHVSTSELNDIQKEMVKSNDTKSIGEFIIDGLDQGTKLSKVIEKRLSVIRNNIELAQKSGVPQGDILKAMEAYNKIRHIGIKEENGTKYIEFIHSPFPEKNIFTIESLIHDDHFLPDTPLTDYLDDHGIGRHSPLFRNSI